MNNNELGAAAHRAAIGAITCALAAAAFAQPVPLRLASSLCSAINSQVMTSQLVPPLSPAAGAGAAANQALAERLEQQRGDYFQRLDAIVPFSGLFATGSADHSLPEGPGTRYSFGLEWELYNSGREEARRQVERARLDGKVQYVQVLRDMEQRQLQENLLAIDQMRSKLLALLYRREADAIKPVLERRRQQLRAGQITRGELAEAEYKAERAELRARHYAGAADVLVYPQAQELINRIEQVELRPADELATRAAERSPELQLQALLGQRAQYLPAARDWLSVRLYAERGKDFERGPYNVAGVRVRVPLDGDRGRDDAIAATQSLYAGQQEAIRASLAQKITALRERLRLKQNDMRVLQSENTMLRAQADVACWRLGYPVGKVGGDPERDVEELTVLLHEKQREILAARLDVLEVLTQLSALVKPRDPQELYTLRTAAR